MNLSVIDIIKLGQQYLKLWPEKPELAAYFSDYKTIQSARFLCRYLPALALFIVIMQIYFGSGYPLGHGSIDAAMKALAPALVYGIFILSIPVQALIILGVQADKFLPPSLASWYRSGIEKAKAQGQTDSLIKLTIYKPRYIDLAQLLQLTFTSKN